MFRSSVRGVLVACLAAAGLAGCEPRALKIAPAGDPHVPVAHPEKRPVTDHVEFTGRTNAVHAVTIQPRVTGLLITRDKKGDPSFEGSFPFKEGDEVKAGALLFEIDPRPYKAQLDAAKAQVAQNKAAIDYAVSTNKRFKDLAKKQPDAVSARELEQYEALEKQASAALDLVSANVASAQLNYDWTKIKAPINGRISRYFLTPGNLVNQDATQLTTLVSMDPIYVYFDMDEPTLLRIKRAINEKRIQAAKGDATVEMGLAGEEGYPHKGTINFFDNQVNAGTGSISIRGIFSNPRPEGGTHLMVPGMFVRVRLPIGQPQEELLVIDRAISSEQNQKTVHVMDAETKVVQSRRVSVGSLQDDGLRVITHGLQKDNWVLVGGLQQIRPGMTIQPEFRTMPSLEAPAVPLEKAKGKKLNKK
ncbi:MAG: efflux RND transporter periplasmic adaptor subunit [Gemmataceae bacterium]|nr:efflux RND transporter periplasmic adaptor subunit [Gemmataceae bacterium]